MSINICVYVCKCNVVVVVHDYEKGVSHAPATPQIRVVWFCQVPHYEFTTAHIIIIIHNNSIAHIYAGRTH